jgi:RNase adaptor protein for sRNA GlmZ degradation
MKLILISGLSGAGKSVAMHALEDLSYYCVDNLPIKLLSALVEELEVGSVPDTRAAVSIDARNPASSLQDFPALIEELRNRCVLNALVFLEADDDNLIKRFSETRRKHPLTADNTSLPEAISRERMLLETVREIADVHIDTNCVNSSLIGCTNAKRKNCRCCFNHSATSLACRKTRTWCSTPAVCPIRIGSLRLDRSRAVTKRSRTTC